MAFVGNEARVIGPPEPRSGISAECRHLPLHFHRPNVLPRVPPAEQTKDPSAIRWLTPRYVLVVRLAVSVLCLSQIFGTSSTANPGMSFSVLANAAQVAQSSNWR
jgi:hypothetical protein